MKQVDKKSETTFSESYTVEKLRGQLRGKGDSQERQVMIKKGDILEGKEIVQKVDDS